MTAPTTLFTVWVTTQNTDLTEGRGYQRPVSYWSNEASAVEDAKGRGVMGVGDGEVVMRTYYVHPDDPKRIEFVEERVYGYRKGWNGKWGSGWIDNRDAPVNDPEYPKYLELKRRFEK